MRKLLALVLPPALLAGPTALVADPPRPADKPAHSAFFRDFEPAHLAGLCEKRVPAVGKCEHGSRGLSFTWKGQTEQEDFKLYDVKGPLSAEQVDQVLAALKPHLVKLAKTGKGALDGEPKDSITDRPMRLLQPGLVAAGTTILPASLHGFYFTYKDGKVAGAVDVLAVPESGAKGANWMIVVAVHEVAR